MKTIKFRNEKGQYCPENVNNGFTVEMPFCNIIVKRAGQQSPEQGNAVCVQLDILKKKDSQPIYFRSEFFGLRLNTGGIGFWQNSENGRDGLQTFCAKTWREAFKEAKDYVFSEIEKYEALIKEREQALIDAEF